RIGCTEQPARAPYLPLIGGDLGQPDQSADNAESALEALNLSPVDQATLIEKFRRLVLTIVVLHVESGGLQEHAQRPAIARLRREASELFETAADTFFVLHALARPGGHSEHDGGMDHRVTPLEELEAPALVNGAPHAGSTGLAFQNPTSSSLR